MSMVETRKALEMLEGVLDHPNTPEGFRGVLERARAEVEEMEREQRITNGAFAILNLWAKPETVKKARDSARAMEKAVREALAPKT